MDTPARQRFGLAFCCVKVTLVVIVCLTPAGRVRFTESLCRLRLQSSLRISEEHSTTSGAAASVLAAKTKQGNKSKALSVPSAGTRCRGWQKALATEVVKCRPIKDLGFFRVMDPTRYRKSDRGIFRLRSVMLSRIRTRSSVSASGHALISSRLRKQPTQMLSRFSWQT